MTFLELFDETLDINATENYELALQAGKDGLAFCILDTLRNKLVLIRSHEPEDNRYAGSEDLREIIRKDDFLTRKFSRTRITIPVSKFTLVPQPLYDQSKNREYFSLNHRNDDNEIILSDRLNEPDAYSVYSIPSSLHEVISSSFPGVTPCSHIKPLIDNILRSRPGSYGYYIQVHLERDFFNLVIFRDNHMKLCNTYGYRSISDVLYYVMNAIKRMEIKQEDTIIFSGLTGKYEDLVQHFSPYFRSLKFAEPRGDFSFSYVFNEIKLHRYLNLFSLVNCG